MGADLGLAPRVDAALQAFLDRRTDELDELAPEVTPLLEAARDALVGGKRLRPAFCYWGWRAAGGVEDDARIVTAAAALELVHASALIHDDVMDASTVRRGRPAAHRGFADMHADRAFLGPAERFGSGAAILLGDLLLSWSDPMLRSAGFETKALDAAFGYFDALRAELVAGQFLDLLAQSGGENSEVQAMRVLRYKAAKYTVERPLQLGAALAGADEPLLDALSAYGIPLGEAFQLRDDILGTFGDPSRTGKPAGDDLREGKRTVLTARALEAATTQDRAVLSASIGNADLDAAGVDEARAAVRRTGTLDGVERLIDELTSDALGALERAPIEDEAARTALRELAVAATQRAW